MTAGPSILAIGNVDRGDDGVGPYVLAGLAGRVPQSALFSSDGNVSALLDILERCPELIVIDAADARSADLAPGEVRHMDADDPGLAAAGLRASTHAIGIAEAIALARSLGILPPRLSIIAIAGNDFTVGAGLSAPVAKAADRLIEELAGSHAHA
jgi:hydrogenase maturation protease